MISEREYLMGLKLTFEGLDWSVSDDSRIISMVSKCLNADDLNHAIKETHQILRNAKVNDISQLKNIPVEVTFEDNKFKNFRILTEVL